MSSQGWIKLHRKMLEWEWYSDINVCRLFTHCLLKANHKNAKWQGITINSGTFISSYSKLSCETGLSVKQIRNSLKKLKSTGEVAVTTTSKYSMYTIACWESYQDEGKQKGSLGAGEGQARGRRGATNKNEKNEDNDEEAKEKETVKPKKQFSPPSLDEVNQYIFEKQYNVDAEEFISYYKSNGWKVGRNKMVSWKSAVTNWQKRDYNNAKNKQIGNEYKSSAQRVSEKLTKIGLQDIEENGFIETLGNRDF